MTRRSQAPCLAVVATTQAILASDPRHHVALLTPAERQRASGFRSDAARNDFIAAHALVRHVAGALAGVEAAGLTLVQRCDRCGGPHGAPRLVERPWIHVSVSHAGGMVAAAASRAPVGLDLERWEELQRFEDPLCLDVAFGPAAASLAAACVGRPARHGVSSLGFAALVLWQRKECLVKLGLASLDDPPRELPEGWVETQWSDRSLRASATVVARWPARVESHWGLRNRAP